MPRQAAPLNDLQIRKLKPKDAPFKLSDGNGLYLYVTPAGGKLWRLNYRIDGKAKTLSFGSYPNVTLEDARIAARDAKRLVAQSTDPAQIKRADKSKNEEASANTFEVIAREWHRKFSADWVEHYRYTTLMRLETHIFPFIGKLPVKDIEHADLHKCLDRIVSRSSLAVAHHIRRDCARVFAFAIATGRGNRNVAADLIGALPPAKGGHHPAVTDPAELARVVKSIDTYYGRNITVPTALRLIPMLLCRPGELRNMEWSEVDLDNALVSIPAEKMKMDAPHLIPLSTQAVTLFRTLKEATGHGRYCFPRIDTPLQPMSYGAINQALRYLGFTKDEVVGHGFRATARTILDEVLHVRPDFIEHQLAHAVRDANGRAYNRCSFLPERAAMMQTWADYIDALKGEV